MPRLPGIFLSHGAPTLAVEDGPAHRFLKDYGADLGTPEAILVVSAHWATAAPSISTTARPETIHDFSGFPEDLYGIRYPAPGATRVAERAAALLDQRGFGSLREAERGLDHGAWIPLLLMYPRANIPVAQLSIQPQLGAEHHLRLGEAIAPLRKEGVLVIASGGLTHNLAEFGRHDHDDPAPGWVAGFAEWMAAAARERRIGDLLDYRRRAPHAARNHPTEEHLLPFFVAMSAGGPEATGTRVHASYTYGVLAMDVYEFA